MTEPQRRRRLRLSLQYQSNYLDFEVKGAGLPNAPPLFSLESQLKVQIEYHDNDSFTVEEVVKLAQHNYGKSVHVEITPDSTAPHDAIYFALQQIVTYRQLSLLYDNRDTYQKDIKMLRAEILGKVAEILDSVIIDNESKVA